MILVGTMKETSKIKLYIDPPTHHFLNDRLFNIELCSLNGDQILAPWVFLHKFFTSRGISVHTADFLTTSSTDEINIYISVGNINNYKKVAKLSNVIISAFFAMECPVVEPTFYRKMPHVSRHFKRIYSWSDSKSLEPFIGEPLRLESFCWPQSFEKVHDAIWSKKDRKFLVMINANKLPCIYWQELYTERLRAIEFFSRTGEIDLYGVGWDGPSYKLGKTIIPATIRRITRYLEHQWDKVIPDPLLAAARRVYCGPAVSKSETLGNYTFALCFENMILKGWITEKIFDCFFAGTIPIYWGSPDIEEHVPSECFIDMRRFKNYEELRSYLKSLSEKDIRQYKENVREYLKSPRFRPFSKDAFVEIFRRLVEEDTGIRLA
ncbi:MAG: hypothetical protein FVQ85_18330 [Planctomycetes bacterium]|nr:hypothetical protein [Planctomycetota bacterium]